MSGETLKQQLFKKLDQLSEDRIREVVDFVGYLLSKQEEMVAPKSDNDLEPNRDPLLKLIGIADVEPFAHNIDEELYGR